MALGLTKLQQQTLDFFAKSDLSKKFYWTGGTLLSTVYLNHRFSEDIDLFSDKPFLASEINDFVESLKKKLGLKNVVPRKIHDRLEFLITNGDKLRIEFVLYEHPKLKSRKTWNGILIDSMFDIGVNKTMAMFDRNEAKDIFDLYFLVADKHLQVKDLLAGVNKKFGLKMPEDGFWSESMKALNNLEKIKPFLIANSEKEKGETIEKIKKFFLSRSSLYLHGFLK